MDINLLEKVALPDELIYTKLAPPPLRRKRLIRLSLLERLDAGLAHKLTLISAPAGYGKTSLAAEWARRLQDRETGMPVGWVSLDAGDNDSLRFWRYVFTAVQSLDEVAGRTALAQLESVQDPFFVAILTKLVNTLECERVGGLLVLEDYHVIKNDDIHSGLTFMIEHLPSSLRLAILSRGDPPLPLALLRAKDEIGELGIADLRFSESEVDEFLESAVPHPLVDDAAARLASRTEGWPAGLRLAALALGCRPETHAQEEFLDTFTGSHRPILEFLTAAVFAAQPTTIQDFLLETSFLSRLCGSLCDAATCRSDSTKMLEALARDNLFLDPLDGSGEWYRYHGLFAEAMQTLARRRLEDKHLQGIADAASRWYEDQIVNFGDRSGSMLYDAIEAALGARAFERASCLIEGYIKPRLADNEYHTLRCWLCQLPDAQLDAHPDLALAYAQALIFTGESFVAKGSESGSAESIPRLLEIAESSWKARGNEVKLGEVLAFRSLIAIRHGDFPLSFALAHRALAVLPEVGHTPSEIEWRAVSLIMIGWESFFAGRLIFAIQQLFAARNLFQKVRNLFGLFDAGLGLGLAYTGRMQVQQAAEFYRLIIDECESAPISRKDRLKYQGRGWVGLAKLAYEQDDLETASNLANRALECGIEIENEELLAASALLLSSVEVAQGKIEPARERLVAVSARINRPQTLRELQAGLARLDLATGNLAAARRWADALTDSTGIAFQVREQETFILARLKIAAGLPAEVISELETALKDAYSHGRTRSELELRILLAEAFAALGRQNESVEAFRRVLTLTFYVGYRRVIKDEIRLPAEIQSAALAGLEAQEAAWAISLISSGDLNYRGKCSELFEPLSPQEQRVLRLLGEGLANEEIARELIVSVNTVKTHVKSIYRKLQINRRSQAHAAARRLAAAEIGADRC